MKKKQHRQKIGPYIDRSLFKKLAAYCAARNATQSSVVGAALIQYLDDTKDWTLLLRRVDAQNRATQEVHRDLEIVAEAFSAFVQLWFAHTPKIEESHRDSAERHALRRYQDFVAFVRDEYTGGRRFINDLAKDGDLGDQDELSRVASSSQVEASDADSEVSDGR